MCEATGRATQCERPRTRSRSPVTYAYGLAQSITFNGPTAVVNFAGVPGYSYEVQRTTNLLSPNWTVLLITNAPPKGVWQFIETNPPPGGAYYRTRQH